MNSVWIVTEGDYSDNHIVGVFSTKEKAYEFYNIHVEEDCYHRYTSYYEPEEYIIDKTGIPDVGVVGVYKNKGNWIFTVSGVLDKDKEDNECDRNLIGSVHEGFRNSYDVYVYFNPDREVMKKSAQDYFYKYLASKEGI